MIRKWPGSFFAKLHSKSALVWSVSLVEVFIYLMQLFFSLPVLQCPLLTNSVHRVIDNLLDLFGSHFCRFRRQKASWLLDKNWVIPVIVRERESKNTVVRNRALSFSWQVWFSESFAADSSTTFFALSLKALVVFWGGYYSPPSAGQKTAKMWTNTAVILRRMYYVRTVAMYSWA